MMAKAILCDVYGLYSTRDKVIRYIGQSTKGTAKRHAEHLSHARLKRRKKDVTLRLSQWIRSEWRTGHGVLAITLVHNAEWNTIEREQIALFRQRGAVLINLHDGGAPIPPSDGLLQRMKRMTSLRQRQELGTGV